MILDVFLLGCSHGGHDADALCVMLPNDPKLSDGGGCRGPCMAGGKAAAEARALAAVAVRCSAWLAVAVIVMERRSSSER